MGARKFVVFQIGPIGCIPTIAKKSNHDGVCDGGPNLLVSYFNQMLQPMLQNMTFSLSGSMFVLGQANSLSYDAIINPSKYGTDSTHMNQKSLTMIKITFGYSLPGFKFTMSDPS